MKHREENDQYMQQCWRPLHRQLDTDTGCRVAERRGNRRSLSKRLLNHVCADKLYDEMLLQSQDAAALTSVESRALHVPQFPIWN